MNDRRPDPEKLLQQIHDRESRRERGRLKIFFGAWPGVGKTYAMLEDARDRAREGLGVVVGIVETHGRPETEALLDGNEILPRREYDYRGVKLREFDIDGALGRKPGLLLLDELAHTNAPESRHARRWQDARELLAAGIDVYTTLNVQHIESLNDVVAQITGVTQRETVPDSILDLADAIVLVDLPPEELQKRLAEGKVYLPEQARRAADQYFKEQNLIALRELALRFMANRVNVQVQFARRDATVDRIWPTNERLLVCVGPSPGSARLIRSTRRLATLLQSEWIALTVETPAVGTLPEDARQRIAQHQRLAQELGAETVTVTADDMPEAVVQYARSRNVTKMIVGKPVLSWWRERLKLSLVDRIIRKSGDIDIYVIRGEGEGARPVISPRMSSPVPWGGYLVALANIGVCTLLTWLMYPRFALADLIMVYLVGIMLTAMRGRRGPAMFASLLSVLLFDILYVPPRFTISVAHPSYLLTFAVMLVAGVLMSTLILRIRRQMESARQGHLRTAAQNRLGKHLLEARTPDQILRIGACLTAEAAECPVVMLVPDAHGRVRTSMAEPAELELGEKELAVAQWVHDQSEPAGRGTDTLASAEALYLPLRSAEKTVGVIGIFDRERSTGPERIGLYEAFAGQIAMAMEVKRLEEDQRLSQLQIETERMQSSMLSSVSHDLRTPLATIIGAAGSLLESGADFSTETRQQLLADIHQEAERLSRLIGNLLAMTRLDGGAIEVKREPQPLEEIVETAISTLSRRLEGRELEIEIPPDLPMVEVDGILVQQVLLNLLENALNFAPADRPIRLRACRQGDRVVVQVIDEGPGVPVEEREKIFEKFYRGAGGRRAPGSGLGLAIARGIVQAHGGTIHVSEHVPRGSVFSFTLPVSQVLDPVELPEEG